MLQEKRKAVYVPQPAGWANPSAHLRSLLSSLEPVAVGFGQLIFVAGIGQLIPVVGIGQLIFVVHMGSFSGTRGDFWGFMISVAQFWSAGSSSKFTANRGTISVLGQKYCPKPIGKKKGSKMFPGLIPWIPCSTRYCVCPVEIWLWLEQKTQTQSYIWLWNKKIFSIKIAILNTHWFKLTWEKNRNDWTCIKEAGEEKC